MSFCALICRQLHSEEKFMESRNRLSLNDHLTLLTSLIKIIITVFIREIKIIMIFFLGEDIILNQAQAEHLGTPFNYL